MLCSLYINVHCSLVPCRLTPTFCITGLGASAKRVQKTCNTKSGGKPGNEAMYIVHCIVIFYKIINVHFNNYFESGAL